MILVSTPQQGPAWIMFPSMPFTASFGHTLQVYERTSTWPPGRLTTTRW